MNRWSSRKLLKAGVSIILSVGLCALVLRYLNLEELVHVMAQIRWVWFGAMLLCLVAYQALRALRLATLVGSPMAYGRLFNTTCTQAFLNMFLPLGLGEAGLVVLLKTRHQVGLHQGTAVLIVSRFLDVAALCAGYLLTLLFAWQRFPAYSGWLAVGLSALVAAGALVLGSVLRLRGPGVLREWRFVSVILDHVRVFRYALQEMMSLRALLAATLVSSAMWVLMFGYYYSTVVALGFWMNPFSALFFFVLVALIWTLPVKGVAYVGTHHASWFFALRVLDFNATDAAVIASSSHLLFTACLCLIALPPAGTYAFQLLRRLRAPAGQRLPGTMLRKNQGVN
jgi:uncharacterized membrane protein YbhN (UPF0104 family)